MLSLPLHPYRPSALLGGPHSVGFRARLQGGRDPDGRTKPQALGPKI